ncbi:MAG TPA: hypothetical protein VMA98_07925 [Candidatus Acidoferrales bacterium]|nr:hypothetical protein [Candidatus Acidoferrales bacterium]
MHDIGVIIWLIVVVIGVISSMRRNMRRARSAPQSQTPQTRQTPQTPQIRQTPQAPRPVPVQPAPALQFELPPVLPDEAPPPPPVAAPPARVGTSPVRGMFGSSRRLVSAIIAAEVLGPPKAMQEQSIWSPRHSEPSI